MPVRPARVGRVGVIGAPVAKAAVVTKAVTPGPSPVAKLRLSPQPSHRARRRTTTHLTASVLFREAT